VATERRRSRCRERLERLSDSTLDASSLQLEVIAELRRAVGFDRWCWPLADPETLIPLSGVAEHDYGPQVGRSLALEYSGGDFAAMHVVARQPEPVASLSAETRGDLARSPRWDQVLRPVGIGDESPPAATRSDAGAGSRRTATTTTRPSRPRISRSSRISARGSAPRCAAGSTGRVAAPHGSTSTGAGTRGNPNNLGSWCTTPPPRATPPPGFEPGTCGLEVAVLQVVSAG
jgi:hypothetical protein